MIIAASILAAGLIVAVCIFSYSQSLYHMKPKKAFATATIVGRTEESESMQLTTSLFEDETEAQWAGKVNKLFEMREQRMGFQNQRLMDIQRRQEELIEEEKAKKPTLVS